MISQERCRILLPGGGVCISLNDVQTERMQIGFIGAGKVGVSLGKYFKEKGRNVGGYYSLTARLLHGQQHLHRQPVMKV